MSKQRKTKRRREKVTGPSKAPTRNRVPWRRWLLLLAVAVGVALVLAWCIPHRAPLDPEQAPLEEAIVKLASEASPDATPLLHEAGRVADNLLRQFPNNGKSLEVVARLYRGLGMTKDAVRCWERCLELDPELGPTVHAAIGSVAFEEGDLDTAAEHYRMAAELDPGSSVYPVHLAEALINRGKQEEAVEVLKETLKTRPTSMPANVLIGQAYFQLQQYEEARKHLEMGVEMGPEYTNAYYSLARTCAALGDQEKSKEYLATFKNLQAQEAQLHRDTLKTLNDTRGIRQVVCETYTAAAQVYIAHGDYQQGEEHLTKGAEFSANAVECRIVLAWLYERQGRTDEALQTLAELGERAQNNLRAQMSIASAYTRLDRFDEAESAYRKAIELTPLRAGGYAALANFYIQAGLKLPEAKTLAQKAVEMEPVAEHYFLLSLTCQKNEDFTGASSAVDQAIALDSNNQGYRRLRQQLRAMSQPTTPIK